MQQNQPAAGRPHSLTVEGRERASISGVIEVLSYDDASVLASSDYGDLYIEGTSLRIKSFDVSGGLLLIEGSIDSVRYLAGKSKKSGLLERLFR